MTAKGEWKLISEHEPPHYVPILMAFADHWNPVAGFYSGKRTKEPMKNTMQFYQHTAHECNKEIVEENPKWWTECPEVPHRVSR